MTENDLITEEQLDTVESILRRAYRGRLLADFVGGVVFCALSLFIAYLLPDSYDQSVIVPLIIFASITLASVLAFGDWRDHRVERNRIAVLRGRLRAGDSLSMQDVLAPNRAV